MNKIENKIDLKNNRLKIYSFQMLKKKYKIKNLLHNAFLKWKQWAFS